MNHIIFVGATPAIVSSNGLITAYLDELDFPTRIERIHHKHTPAPTKRVNTAKVRAEIERRHARKVSASFKGAA